MLHELYVFLFPQASARPLLTPACFTLHPATSVQIRSCGRGALCFKDFYNLCLPNVPSELAFAAGELPGYVDWNYSARTSGGDTNQSYFSTSVPQVAAW